ncbi:MAG: cytochrome P450 [Myxococcota bacterium]
MHASAHSAPGPRGLPLLRNTLDLWSRDPLALLRQRHRRYGDFVHTHVAGLDRLLINDPDAIRHVLQHNSANYTKGPAYAVLGVVVGEGLLTSEGDFWLRQRRLAQPAFHKKYLERFAAVMVAATETMLASWSIGDQVDIAEEMMRLTFKIVGEALFSAAVEDKASEIGELVTEALGLFERFASVAMLLPDSMLGRGRGLPLPASRRIIARIDEIVMEIIEQRRHDPAPHHDLLQMLMDARDDDGASMTDLQLKDEVTTLILAGHETTASALTWTLSLLASHRDIEAQLVEEHRRVLGDRSPTLSDVRELPRTERVVKEAMRLYPPAWTMTRQAREDDEAGGYAIAAGAVVQIAPWTLHRHPGHWMHAERFDPDRFSPARSEHRHPWAYLPFGGGARVCIGKGFAMLEAQLVLATMLRQFVVVPRRSAMPIPQPSVTLRPRDGMPSRLAAR